MSARLLAYSLPLLALSCAKQEEAPRRPRGLSPAEAPAAAAEAEQPATPPSAPPSSLPSPFVSAAPDPGALSSDAGSAADEPVDAGPARDLSRELSVLIGQPLRCIDLAAVAATGGRVDFAVNVHVVPSGRITRAEVSAKGQPERALRCVEQLATSRGLRGPVPGAPLQVSTTVSMQVVATPP